MTEKRFITKYCNIPDTVDHFVNVPPGGNRMNVHEDCEYYVEQNDMCLLFFELGFHNVSKNYPSDCVDHFAFADDEEAY